MWGDGGVPVTAASGFRKDPVVAPIDGGYLFVWAEGATGDDVYAQKLDNFGNRVWSGLGVQLDGNGAEDCQHLSLQVVPDGFGGVYVIWISADFSSSWIAVNHIDGTGTLLFPAPLVLLQSHYATMPSGAVDSNGDLLIGVAMSIELPVIELFAAKVTYDGMMPWGTNGTVLVCDASGREEDVHLVTDATGLGAYVFWGDGRNGNDEWNIWLQHLTGEGHATLDSNGVRLCTAPGGQIGLRVCPSINEGERDGTLLCWLDRRSSVFAEEIYGQKLGMDAQPEWETNGVVICGGTDENEWDRSDLQLSSDGAGGALCAWRIEHDNQFESANLNMQRVDSSGLALWQECGMIVSDAPWQQYDHLLQLLVDKAILTYTDRQNGSSEIRGQALQVGDGARQWEESGREIAEMGTGRGSTNDYSLEAVALGGERIAVVWEDGRRIRNGSRLYFQVLNSFGMPEYSMNGIPISANNSGVDTFAQSIYGTSLLADGSGGFFASFQDGRFGPPIQIRLTHIDTSGEFACDSVGQIVHESSFSQYVSSLVADAANNVYLAIDERPTMLSRSVYVTRIGNECNGVWPTPTRLGAEHEFISLATAVEATDGCLIVWELPTEDQTDWIVDLYCSKINSEGTIEWTSRFGTALPNILGPTYLSDGHSGLYGVWNDLRDGDETPSVSAQHVDSAGNALWGVNGSSVTDQLFEQLWPTLTVTTSGEVVVAWTDFRDTFDSGIYGQRFTPNGTRLWPSDGLFLSGGPGMELNATLIADDSNGVYIAWDDCRNLEGCDIRFPRDLYAIHLDENGNIADPWWHDGGDKLSSPRTRSLAFKAISDKNGGAFATWIDRRSVEYYGDVYEGVYAQKFGWQRVTQSTDVGSNTALEFRVQQNSPNPFNPTTTLSFSLPKSSHVELTVYNVLGRVVMSRELGMLNAGMHDVVVDGAEWSSGIYFASVSTGEWREVVKMALVR